MKTWQHQTTLDALICGLPIERIDPERPYGALRGNATRAFGLANNLARQGWKTGLIVEPNCQAVASQWISDNLHLVTRSNLEAAAGTSEVLLLCSTNLKTLQERVPEALPLAHPRKWLAFCFDYNDGQDLSALLSGVIGVSLNNDLVAENWLSRKLDLPVHVVPYGVDEHPYIDASIVPVARPTAVWVGALRMPSTLQRIVRFAEVNPECDVKVAAGLVFDQNIASGDGSSRQPYIEHREGPVPREQFEAVVRRWCGREQPANLHYLGARAGENAQLLGAASLALGFSRRPGQQHDDSKLLDYLRSGLPVLADDGQPSCRFVSDTGHGCVIPFAAEDEALREGYQRCLALSEVDRRRMVADLVREHLGWPSVARKIAGWIQFGMKEPRDKARDRLRAHIAAWPELRREAAVCYYEPESLTTPRFNYAHVMEVVERARQRHPGARLFYLTDTNILLNEPDVEPLAAIEAAAGIIGKKVFICAFFSDERLAKALQAIQALPDSAYLMPRVFTPTARYFHHNALAHEVLCSEASLPRPKFSLADFENLIQALESTRNVPGDFVEVGVFQGRSAHCALTYMRRAGLKRRAWLLDVFEGFTYSEALQSRDAYWAGSHTDTSEEAVRQWMSEFPDARVLKANIITDPLPAEINCVAVANIDVDMYEAVVAGLQRVVPLTTVGSIIVLEDQGHTPPLGGAWLAVREFLDSAAARDFTSVHLASGQMYLVRHRISAAAGVDTSRPAIQAVPDHRPALKSGKAPLSLLYIPWIEGQTGALVKLLEAAGGVEFIPLPLCDMVPGRPGLHRSEIVQMATRRPADFRRLLGELVARVTKPVNALLLTVDWCGGLRDATRAFRETGFPTVLVPHESVFAREDLYYRDPETGTDVPQAELALLWGGAQREIFTRRGLEEDRFRVVGSPKLDFVRHYRSSVPRGEFYKRWGLTGEKPAILFATQPLDSQFDTPQALAAQSQAIDDCLQICRKHGWQLIVRLPPARGREIIAPSVQSAIEQSGIAALDGAQEGRYLATPPEALFHADAVVSINSTMLLEAALMERPSLSLGYVECEQFWHRKGGLPLVRNRQELEEGLKRAMAERRSLFTEEGWRWVRWAFSPGEFDGQSVQRIHSLLCERWPEPRSLAPVADYLLRPQDLVPRASDHSRSFPPPAFPAKPADNLEAVKSRVAEHLDHQRWAEAARVCEQGLASAPRDLQLLTALGFVREQLKDLAGAHGIWRQILEIDPRDENARQRLPRHGLEPSATPSHGGIDPRPLSPLRINFPMCYLTDSAPLFQSGESNLSRKLSLIDRQAPFLLLYQTLVRLGHSVAQYAPGECDLNICWTGKQVPASEKDKSIIMEVGWLPRWNFQVSPTGSNYLGHYSRQYQYEPLQAGEDAFIKGYLTKLRAIFADSVNWDKVKRFRAKVRTEFVLFAFQLANDFNLKFSDTEFAVYYSTEADRNLELAQACVDKAAGANCGLPLVFKQHPFDPTQDFRNRLRTDQVVLDNQDDLSTHEIFASGLCRAVVAINSNTLHEAAAWNIPCICLGKLIWDRSTRVPPFSASLRDLDKTIQSHPYDDGVVLAYLYYLVSHQWTLADFQNPKMVAELLRTKGLCRPQDLRRALGLL